MPFARALCDVVYYYLSEERTTRLVRVLSEAGAPGVAFDEAISEALGMCCLITRFCSILRQGADVSQWQHAESFTAGYGLVRY